MKLFDRRLAPDVAAELAALDAALAGEATTGRERELAALVSAVRTVRPEPAPAFAADLDARVAAGFAAARRTGPGRASLVGGYRRLLPAAGAVASLLIVVLVAGGAFTGHHSHPLALHKDVRTDAGTAGRGQATAARAEASPSASARGAKVSTAPAPTTATPTAPGPRRVERTASLVLTTPRRGLADAADRVVRVTSSFGGIVASSDVSTGVGAGGASFDLRLPSGRLAAAIAALSHVGHVRSLQQSTLDITRATTTAADRLDEARAERRALLLALVRAQTAERIDALKIRLRFVRTRIAVYRAAAERLDRRAAYASVAVSLQPAGRHVSPAGGGGGGDWTPGDALHDAVRILAVAAGAAVVAVAVLVPVAIVALLGAWAGAVVRRRRRERALDPA